MAIDPRVLESIGNPTGGRLTDMGGLYLAGKQSKRRDELTDLKKNQAMQEMAITGAKVANAYASTSLEWLEKNQDKSDDEFAQYQMEQWEILDPAHQQFVPKDFQTKEQLQMGKNTTESLLSRLDPSKSKPSIIKKVSAVTSVKDGTIYKKDEVYKDDELISENPEYPVYDASDGSEFERHINWFKANDIPMDRNDQWYRDNLSGDKVQEALVRKKRLGTRAGLEQTRQQELTYKSTQTENRRDIESRLRGEYAKGIDAYKTMSRNIESAITAMGSGDTGMADTMMAQALSDVQEGGNVRAFAMYSQFDKSFGNVLERTVKGMRRFLEGKRTPGEREEIQRTLEYMRDNYAEPKTTAVRDRYRADAIEEGLEPFKAIPPESPEDIRDSTLVDKKKKLELLRQYYPSQFGK